MNKQRRKLLEKACGFIGEALSIIEDVKEDEENAFYNMPDGLQNSERGEQIEENINNLEDIIGNLEEACGYIEEM